MTPDLSDLDGIGVPDRWPDIAGRAGTGPVRSHRAARSRWPLVLTAAAVVVIGAVVGGLLLVDRPDPETLSTAGGPVTTEAPVTTLPGPPGPTPRGCPALLVGLQPDGLDATLATVWTDLLAWSGEPSWEVGGSSATARHPADPDRTITAFLAEPGCGEGVVGFDPGAMVPAVTDDGRLGGFRLDGFAPGALLADAASVEVLAVTGPASFRPLAAGPDATGERVLLDAPIAPRQAETYLVVPRDEAGQAVNVTGVALRRPDRLTVDLAGFPAEATPVASERVADALGALSGGPTEVDASGAVYVGEVVPGEAAAVIVPWPDRGGLCLAVLGLGNLAESAASTCTMATVFNRDGIRLTAGGPGYHWAVLVFPLGSDVADLGPEALVHPSKQAVSWVGLDGDIVLDRGLVRWAIGHPNATPPAEPVLEVGSGATTITLTYGPPLSVTRGACWHGTRWDGSDWIDPFMVGAVAPQWIDEDRPPNPPRTEPDEFFCNAAAITGPGPEVIRLPPDFLAPASRYRFCQDHDAADPARCFTVDTP